MATDVRFSQVSREILTEGSGTIRSGQVFREVSLSSGDSVGAVTLHSFIRESLFATSIVGGVNVTSVSREILSAGTESLKAAQIVREILTSEWRIDYRTSCYFQIRWDWSDSKASNKWTPLTQAYRIRAFGPLDPPPGISEDDMYDNGFVSNWSRHRIRGTGKAMQIYFETDEVERDFELLGWAVAFSGNTKP